MTRPIQYIKIQCYRPCGLLQLFSGGYFGDIQIRRNFMGVADFARRCYGIVMFCRYRGVAKTINACIDVVGNLY